MGSQHAFRLAFAAQATAAVLAAGIAAIAYHRWGKGIRDARMAAGAANTLIDNT
ncbi:MAG: hypothetical protein ACUVWR_06095 [Anaerolineae bacterium]